MADVYCYEVASVDELLKHVESVTSDDFKEGILRALRQHDTRRVSSEAYGFVQRAAVFASAQEEARIKDEVN